MISQKLKFLAFVGSDLLSNVGLRSFQMFVVWYYLKELHAEHALAQALLYSWLTSTLLLPISGIIAESKPKRSIIAFGQVSSLVSLILFLFSFFSPLNEVHKIYLALTCFILLTISCTLMSPLEASVIPVLFPEKEDVSKAFRLKEGLYTVNIAFGPALSSFLIAKFGGSAALWVSSVSYFSGTIIATWLYFYLRDIPLETTKRLNFYRLLALLKVGFSRSVKIPEERIIGFCSLIVNFVLIPFVFLLLPQKLVVAGYGMIQVAATEICLGLSSAFAALYLVKHIQNKIGWHNSSVFGFILITSGIILASVTSEVVALCFDVSLVGAGICIFNITIITARSLAVPAGFRSAMESSLLFLCTASVPCGLFLCNKLIGFFSSNEIIQIGSLGLIFAVASLYFSQSIKRFLEKEDVSDYYLKTYPELFIYPLDMSAQPAE